MRRRGWIIGVALLLGACEGPSHAVVNSYHDHARISRDSSADKALQSAAFEHLKGMTRPESIAFLEQDGFTCAQSLCQYVSEKKLTAADVIFGLRPPGDRVFADRRAYRYSYALNIDADVVRSPADIKADARFEHGKVPWHRSPRPSNYEVTND